MKLITPIAATIKLSKIMRQMSCTNGMIGSMNGVLHVTDDGVAPLKELSLIITQAAL